MRFPPHLVLLLCLAASGAVAGSTSIAASINHSVSTSTSTATSSTSSDSAGSVIGTTSCGMNSRGRRCEVTCSAPKVALCVKAATERMPRCSCR